MEPGEATIKVAEDKIRLVKARLEVEKSKAIAEAKLKVVKDFSNLLNFEAEVTKGSSDAYMCKFQACKAQVARLFPKVNIDWLDLEVSEDEARRMIRLFSLSQLPKYLSSL